MVSGFSATIHTAVLARNGEKPGVSARSRLTSSLTSRPYMRYPNNPTLTYTAIAMPYAISQTRSASCGFFMS